MKYQVVIFDLDGTILNSLDDLADSLNYALEKHNLPCRTLDEVRRFVGNGIRKLIERGVPENTDVEMTDKVHATFTEHYKIHSADKTKAYDGVYDVLEGLKKSNIKLAVLSNKADFAVQDLCEKYFNGYFDVCAGEMAGVPKKPDAAGVYNVVKKLGVSLDECVYVGDSEVDVLTALNSKLDLIAVDWGFRERQLLVDTGASVIVSTTED